MPSRALALLGVVLGYVSIALAYSWPLPVHLGTALTGDPSGDTGVYVWNQWVFQHEAIVERHNPLTTEQILSLTQRVDLSQHNYTAFLNLLALPLIPLAGVVATFNLVFLMTNVLTALAAYALVRRVTDATRSEAWLAGMMFAWSPILVARSTAHFSLVAAAPLPVFILFLIRADRSRRLRCAALAGLCVAWAAFCDVYYAIYCVMITIGYLAMRLVRVSRSEQPAPASLRWALDILIVSVGGLVVGLLLGRGGRLDVLGVPISIRGLYTPMLLLTLLVVARTLLALRPHISIEHWTPSSYVVRAFLVGVVACAGPLSPVIYGLGQRFADGRLVMPATHWRSSPRGVDLLAFVQPNPSHPIVRMVNDAQAASATVFAEYTAAMSLVALTVVVVAMWGARYRPRAGWIALTIGFAALALGPFVYVGGANTAVPGPWALLRYVPLIGSARTPTRFAVVAALGLAVLFAGALAALGSRYPRRRTAITVVAGVLLAFELNPAPRTLYRAAIPSIYRTIAADPRPVRILQLPFGVRDGVSSAGNFTALYQFYQTFHAKRLIGGYLSRISQRRVQDIRSQPTLDALITLSEGGTLGSEHADRIRARGPGFIARANLGYVVIDHARATPPLIEFVIDAWGLEEIEREGPLVLYRPHPPSGG